MITALDHLVLTVQNLAATKRFYCDALGMGCKEFFPADGTTRTALTFGSQKINLHIACAEFEPKAARPTPGSGDLCFLTDRPLDHWQTRLAQHGIPVESGPIPRTGATGPILSIYVRDPDQNLIEISVPAQTA